MSDNQKDLDHRANRPNSVSSLTLKAMRDREAFEIMSMKANDRLKADMLKLRDQVALEIFIQSMNNHVDLDGI